MFPTFYKHCVIYDMGLDEKDWYQITVFPLLVKLRKMWIVVEVIGLIYYQWFLMKTNNCHGI